MQPIHHDSSVQPSPSVEPRTSTLDIYAVLGITRHAPQTLARRMYWMRMESLQPAKERGDRDVDVAIEALNHALAIFTDERLRAEYERAQLGVEDNNPSRAVPRRATREGLVLSVMMATLLAALAAQAWGGGLALVISLVIGMAALLLTVTFPRRLGPDSAFSLLGLRPDATGVEVNLAYEVTAQELLSRVRYDSTVLSQLERLDRAYILLSSVTSARTLRSEGARPSFPIRLALAAWQLAALVAIPIVRMLGVVAGIVRLELERAATKLGRAAERQLRAGSASGTRHLAEYFTALSVQIKGQGEDDVAPILLEAKRRSTLGLEPVAADPWKGRATSSEPLPGGSPALGRALPEVTADSELVKAYVILESAAGNRLVPIRSTPLRIGSGPNCDLVLPAQLELAPEHALLWQRDGVVVMHAVDPGGAPCLVNGTPMMWATLEDGDAVQLGKASCKITIAG